MSAVKRVSDRVEEKVCNKMEEGESWMEALDRLVLDQDDETGFTEAEIRDIARDVAREEIKKRRHQ